MNADAILIMGSNMAENHPVGFQWVVEARERGAKVIHVDPRFSRTSAMAGQWLPLRAGSDLVFLGALICYVLENHREFREYLVHYTNASVIVADEFRDTEDLDGVFSGWNPETNKYDTASWLYRGAALSDNAPPDLSRYESDPTLEDPRCVFQLLKQHFARYTPELVESACGISRERFLQAAETFTAASGPERTGAVVYSVGWTQHSNGVQLIRAAAILQLLLGNMGRPGGGILALRGHASIQGSTDIPTLYDLLPGYLPMPVLGRGSQTLADYVAQHRSRTGWWANFDRYIVSLLCAYYDDSATATNDFGFGWLPRISGDHSHQGYWLEMNEGRMEGLFVLGQNPAVGGPNARLERKALAKLEWLVVRDLVEIETAAFWYDSPEVRRGELRTEDVATEVFFFPAAGHAEKDGCFTNTQRLLQWHEKAVDPPDDARSETWFIYHLGRRLKEKALRDPRPRNAGLAALTWDYSVRGERAEPRTEEILAEINGFRTSDRHPVSSYTDLTADGSTACGCWIYSGVFPSPVENRARERDARGAYGHGWGFAWPTDRRILYNRASARPDGRPWSERKKLVWWDEAAQSWTGLDTPDFVSNKHPDYHPASDAAGDAALAGDKPFLLHPDGLGWLWVPAGLKDGPLPTHYEPHESPIRHPLYSTQQTNPPAEAKRGPENTYAESPDSRFPYVLTTYRLAEHHTAGGMSRTLPHLAELQPEMFCEISPQLAAECDVRHGEWVTVVTPRGLVEARAMVTRRMRPLRIHGKLIHQVGLPYHWGFRGLVKGGTANDLVAISEEPNVRIMETKGLLCNLVRGRSGEGPEALRRFRSFLERPR